MKKLFFSLGVVSVFALIPLIANAASVSTNVIGDYFIYHRDFDNLLLDFVIASNGEDSLSALTIEQSGSAQQGFDYTAVTLWADAGEEGFQGFGYDVNLGNGSIISGMVTFSELGYAFTDTQRFFISIETAAFPRDRTLQYQISRENDKNSDGIFQSGDTGLFLGSGLVDTPDNLIAPILHFKIQRQDFNGPKGFINDLSVDSGNPTYFIEQGTIMFTGEAKDRNGGSVASGFLLVNDAPIPLVNTGTDFSTWEAQYSPADAVEELNVRLRFTDGSANSWDGPVYKVMVDSRPVDQARTSLTSTLEILIADGQDKAILTLTLRDADGNPLPAREVAFLTDRPEDVLSETSLTTNAQGRALVTLTSTKPGEARVGASYGGAEIVSIIVSAVELELPTPPIPSEDQLKTGDLIKGSTNAVYHYDRLGVRHVFFNAGVYGSWYGDDFSAVKTVTDEVLAGIPLGEPVTYRPGSLITAPSINEVYIVDVGRTFRHLSSEDIAAGVVGADWASQVIDLQESLLFSYPVGDPITSVSQINRSELQMMALTIDSELNG